MIVIIIVIMKTHTKQNLEEIQTERYYLFIYFNLKKKQQKKKKKKKAEKRKTI